MSLKVTDYNFQDSVSPGEAYIWPENIMFSASDQAGQAIWWVHRTAEDANAFSQVKPTDVFTLRSDPIDAGQAQFCTMQELMSKAAEFLIAGLCDSQSVEIQQAVVTAATANPPNIMNYITDALYFYLKERKYPTGVRVQDA